MTEKSFWALKKSKKSILGPSYRGSKKDTAKSAKMPWQLPSLNSCHWHKFGPSYGRLKFGAHQTENCNFWKRSFLAWARDDQSLVPIWDTFCPAFTSEESLKCPTKVKISKKIFLLKTSLVCLGASPDIIGKISWPLKEAVLLRLKLFHWIWSNMTQNFWGL